MGSAILLFSCKSKESTVTESLDAIKTEESENLTIIMSENGRKSYLFKTPLLEGYMLGRDPYREFRKGITITTYKDDSLTTINSVLEANYAIYYENRKLWEAKGDVVVTKQDGTRLYTQQLFWNSITKRIYSNVDTRIVTDTDEVIGEGFESDEEMNEPRFRRWKGKMQVDTEQLRKEAQNDDEENSDADAKSEAKQERVEKKEKVEKSVEKPAQTSTAKPAVAQPKKPKASSFQDAEMKPMQKSGGPMLQRGGPMLQKGTDGASKLIEDGGALELQTNKSQRMTAPNQNNK